MRSSLKPRTTSCDFPDLPGFQVKPGKYSIACCKVVVWIQRAGGSANSLENRANHGPPPARPQRPLNCLHCQCPATTAIATSFTSAAAPTLSAAAAFTATVSAAPASAVTVSPASASTGAPLRGHASFHAHVQLVLEGATRAIHRDDMQPCVLPGSPARRKDQGVNMPRLQQAYLTEGWNEDGPLLAGEAGWSGRVERYAAGRSIQAQHSRCERR